MSFLDLFRRKSSLASGVLEGTTDSHSHILFGVDDGIKTLEDSLAVLYFLESIGIKTLWCTPHIMDDLATPTQALKSRFQELQQEYKGNIKLHLAAEYMLDSEFEKRLEQGDLLTYDGQTVLVETSMNVPPQNFMEIIQNIMNKGYRPLLAHPERYRYLGMKDYEYLSSIGVHFQLNLPSLTGYYGESAYEKSHELLRKGMYHRIGSDCHRVQTVQEQYRREALTKETIKQIQLCFKQ